MSKEFKFKTVNGYVVTNSFEPPKKTESGIILPEPSELDFKMGKGVGPKRGEVPVFKVFAICPRASESMDIKDGDEILLDFRKDEPIILPIIEDGERIVYWIWNAHQCIIGKVNSNV